MTLSADPSYQALAATAAAAIGAGSPDVARAILAQWQCELGANAAWPPPRNNPGNIARGLASALGIPHSVAPGANPQPSNPIVTYPTPALGAQAYAAAIATQSRYRAALLAARAGSGSQFVRAIAASGWGTSAGCMLGVYGSGPAVTPGVVLASSTAPSACIARLQRLGVSTDPAHVLTAAEAAAIFHAASPNYKPGDLIYDEAVGQLTGMRVRDVCSGNTVEVLPPILQQLEKGIQNFTDWSWVPTVAVNGGVVVVAAWLVLSGIRDIMGNAPADIASLAAE